MFWNLFRAAGASQIHPHVQLQLFGGPQGQAALLEEQAERFRQRHEGDELCMAVVRAHSSLGLAVAAERLPSGTVACWSSLTPRVGGGELCALGAAVGDGRLPPLAGVAQAIAAMLAALRRCGAEAISTVALQVPVGSGKAWMVRCTNRGSACTQVVDAGSVELVGIAGVGTDPYALLAALEQELPPADGAPV